MKKVSLSQAYAGINRQFLALQAENEKLKARIKELEAQVASQQSFAPDGEAVCTCGDDLFNVNPDGKCAWCKLPRR
jgi:hypothetical protein